MVVICYLVKCTVTPLTNDVMIGGEVCFDSDVFPLLISRCTSPDCHNSTHRAEGIDLTYYDGIMSIVKPGDSGRSKLIRYIKGNDDDQMPPPPLKPLSNEQIQLLVNWIDAGALNQSECSSLTVCDTAGTVSFDLDVLPVIDKYCYGCHSDADPQGGYSFTTYKSTMQSVNDNSLLGSIQFSSGFIGMPYESQKMPECEITLIQKWVDQGALNN